MFEGQSIKDIFIYLFIMGVGLGFFQMVPQAFKAAYKRFKRLKHKADVEELAKELGGVCKNEDECNTRQEQAIKSSLEAMGDDIKDSVKADIQEARKEFKSSISRVHDRIDRHMDKKAVA